MKFVLSESDFQFLKDEMSDAYEMVRDEAVVGNDVFFEVEDVSDFQDEITMAVVDNGMDDEDTVNKKGIRMYLIYDILLDQKRECTQICR